MQHGQTELKLTALYERLSRDDDLSGDSSSIQTQKTLLEGYAKQNSFVPFAHYTDDGWSGGNFTRPGWQRLIEDVEAGKIGTVIVKDMSRVGREYLQTGYYTEIYFPQNNVRFIAVSNNIDSNDRSSGEIAPFLNLMNDWYLRDASRKITQAYQVKGKSGKRVTNVPIYGYRKDPNDKTKWIVDEEAAAVVRKIFQLAVDGYGPGSIARILMQERIESPGYYMSSHGLHKYLDGLADRPYDWNSYAVGCILAKPEYLGHTVNFRSYKKHYKDKERIKRPPEEWLIFKNTHEPIIDEATWNTVQEMRKTKRRHDALGEPNILTGLVFCPDCGKPMYEHRCGCHNYKGEYGHYECSTYTKSSRRSTLNCSSHGIGTKVLMQIVLDALRKISKYAIEHPIAFRKKVEELFAVKQEATIAETRQRLKRLNKRRDELHIMVKKLYESYALEKISEEQFDLMMVDYTKEQAEVKAQIAADEQEIAAYGEDANRADQFLAVVNRFMNFEELTGEMLHSYVERIYVHPKERAPGVCTQQVDIHFKFIGAFPVPVPEPTPEEIAAEEARRKRSIKAHEKYLRQKPHIQAREKAKREAWKKAREAEQASS